MCGLVFVINRDSAVDSNVVTQSLDAMAFRGPDGTNVLTACGGRAALGHNRLQIIGDDIAGHQPMVSKSGRTAIAFNGEIYNYKRLAKQYFPSEDISSDTRLLLELFESKGVACLNELEGMFAFVVLSTESGEWWAVRDRFGIKPLYARVSSSQTVISSETVAISRFENLTPDPLSIDEWRKFRRPCPGHSYFDGVEEILPGTYLTSTGASRWYTIGETVREEDAVFEAILSNVVEDHLVSDVDVTSLLSGGVDSSLIAAMTELDEYYTVGLDDANEFSDVEEFCEATGKIAKYVRVERDELRENWRHLAKLRQEPLSVPNEGLIYAVCRAMPQSTKVVLTGEGADELMFGYDRIFRAMSAEPDATVESFFERYCYSDDPASERMVDYAEKLREGKSALDFCEDFFIHFHLPGLLRRMDISMMAASKEGRVPFVDHRLFEYMYRLPVNARMNGDVTKVFLRSMLDARGLGFVSARQKIGFSAVAANETRDQHYREFQDTVMGELGWS